MTGSENDRIWQYYQAEAAENVFAESHGRISFALKQFQPGQTVLNIGVGDCTFERLGRGRGLEVYSLDPSPDAAAKAAEVLGSSERARAGRSEHNPFSDNRFDGVVVVEVLEHLADAVLEETLTEIRRVLKPGGKLVGTVPADEDLAKQRVVCPECGKVFHRWGHQQSFTLDGLRGRLEGAFAIEMLRRRKIVPWRSRSLLHKAWGLVKIATGHIGVRWPDESICFVARKAEKEA